MLCLWFHCSINNCVLRTLLLLCLFRAIDGINSTLFSSKNHTDFINYQKSKFAQINPKHFPRDLYRHLPQYNFEKLYLQSYWNAPGNDSYHDLLKDNQEPPLKWDWREKGIISSVKNQKQCGGCWAFAVAETVESVYSLQHGVSVPNLSVQEIIDCATNNYGCRGGSTCNALSWLQTSSVPLVPEPRYPLTDDSQKCSILPESSRGVTVSRFSCLKSLANDEEMLTWIIYKYGPVVAGVDATTWSNYLGGIIQYHCGTKLNHAVQIVGYDRTGPVPYYIVRNSWGPNWGNDGYIYIGFGRNTCGITENINVVLEAERGPG